MKPDYSNILLLAVASFSAPFSLSAANYAAEIDPTPLWAQTTGCPAAASARSMAVSAGRVYTVNHTEKNVYYTEGNGWKTIDKTGIPSGVEIGVSPLIASDDDGNLIIPVSPAFPASTTINDAKFVILESGATTVANVIKDSGAWRYFTIPKNTISDSGRIDFISASGQVRTNGGWIYFYPPNGTNASRLVRAWGTWGGYKDKTEVMSGGLSVGTGAFGAHPKAVKGSGSTELLLQTGGNSNKVALYSMDGKSLDLIADAPYVSSLPSGTLVCRGDDRRFYVYAAYENTGYNVSKTMIKVKNALTGSEASLDLNLGSWSGSAYGAGMWVDAEFADDNTIHVYCYLPGKGAWKYKVNLRLDAEAPAAPANAVATLVTQTSGQPGRQDAALSWDAVDDAVSYIIERKTASAAGDAWKVFASKVTATSLVDTDITTSFCYRIKAVSAAGIESDPSAEMRCDPRFIPHAPEWEDLRVYDGYAKLQMLWKWTYGYRPDAYDILRDGEVIAKDIPVLNFIDRYIPAGNRKYEIASVYYKEPGKQASGRRPESARSSIKAADVLPRNHANELYGLTELYNYEITPDSPLAQSAVLSDFTDQNLYRQAAFYKGKWYIAQRWDKTDYNEAVSGGIICVDANAGSSEAIAASAKKIYTYPKGSNVGIAVDDNGAFFIRDGAQGQYEFTKPVTSGRLLKFNDDMSVAVDKVIDLSGVQDGGTKMTFRADYYCIKGDALGGDAKLYLAPSQGGSLGSTGRNAWIIDIASGLLSGSKVYNSHVELGGGGVENYLFPLDQREDILHLVRSNGFYRFNPNNTDDHKQLYKTFSRINNAGGTSLWFNNHLLIITPQSQESKNIGGFLVAKGTPDPAKLEEGHTKASKAEDVLIDYEHIIPVVTVAQKRNDKIEAQNSNGLWFGLEPFYEDDGSPSHVDIYLYIPGLRFAKYRIYPFVNLPGPEVNMSVDIQYDDDSDGNHVDITSFKGTASWAPIEFDGDYRFKSYNLQFLNRRNEIIGEHWFDANGIECDAAGNLLESPRDEVRNAASDGGHSSLSFSIDHLDSHEYQAKLTANFDSANDDRSWTSEPSVASDMTDYEPDAPLGQVKVIKDNNVWPDKADKDILRRNYRIDIDFNAPEFNSTGVPYPVTYYEIWYRKPGDSAGTFPNRLGDLAVMNGDGKAIEHQSVVPGTFDFNNSKRQVVKGESIPVVCCHFHQPQVNSGGVLLDADEDPVNWRFAVRAKYAARAINTAIAKDRETEMVPTSGETTTGVYDIIGIDVNDGENVYPSLTDGHVTVSSNTPIEYVAVYGTDGSLVTTVSGHAAQMLKLNLSHLHPGIYFVSIDGHPGHKIIKR